MQRIQSENFWKCQKNNVRNKTIQKKKNINKVKQIKMTLKH